MPQRETLKRSIGITGPDGVGKTDLALDLINLLRRGGQKVVFCPFPFLPGTVSGKILRGAKKEGVVPIAIKPIYAMNRCEVLPALKHWVATGLDHWVVFDRVWQDGPVYAEALGEPGTALRYRGRHNTQRGISSKNEWRDYVNWLHLLEIWFPEVAQGFYITRPLQESIAIMQQRSGVESVKSDFDNNMGVQRRVRRFYIREFSGLSHWQTIQARGIVSGDREIEDWQVPYLKKMWLAVNERFGIAPWSKDEVEDQMRKAQRMTRRSKNPAARETLKTMYMLSRPSGLRGIRAWMPKEE